MLRRVFGFALCTMVAACGPVDGPAVEPFESDAGPVSVAAPEAQGEPASEDAPDLAVVAEPAASPAPAVDWDAIYQTLCERRAECVRTPKLEVCMRVYHQTFDSNRLAYPAACAAEADAVYEASRANLACVASAESRAEPCGYVELQYTYVENVAEQGHCKPTTDAMGAAEAALSSCREANR